MKKVLITFVAFLTTLNIMAQDLLTFKGIPIDGATRCVMVLSLLT